MALHPPIGPFKKKPLRWSRYRDTNPAATSPLADDLGTAPPEAVDLFPLLRTAKHIDIQKVAIIELFKQIYR